MESQDTPTAVAGTATQAALGSLAAETQQATPLAASAAPAATAVAATPAYVAPPAPTAEQLAAAAAAATAAAAPAAQPSPPPAAAAPAEPVSLRARYADWPQPADARPQPWDLENAGLPRHEQALPDGAPNTKSPIVIKHSYPTLATGHQGAAVQELAGLLAILGYATDITKGQNPWSILTHDVMGAVDQFRADYGVKEDPTPYGGTGPQAQERAAHTVGPYTWEALVRVVARELATL